MICSSHVLETGDPFVTAVLVPATSVPPLFAGVGVDFGNRRRSKLAGWIKAVEVANHGPSLQRVSLTLVTNETLGNCPKYITLRKLSPFRRLASVPVSMRNLNEDCRALLQVCSTAFLASRHVMSSKEGKLFRDADMGFNHRGGSPGFIRYYEDERGSHLVLPDYSGNRFYQSLGNLQTDPLVGLVALDFGSGSALHITGRAVNLFNEEAEQLMPRATLVTVITIDVAVLIKQALQLQLVGAESFSPYNPPVRLLASELATLGRRLTRSEPCLAALVAITRDSSAISTFTFKLQTAVNVPAGSFGIFDFAALLGKQYQHMNQQAPQINDDYVRTWTISNKSEDNTLLSVTVKKVAGGLISSFLHSLSPNKPLLFRGKSIQIPWRGFGGGFTCFSADGSVPAVMLWCAAGIGITPFLAWHRELQRLEQRKLSISFKIILLFSCRGDEANLISELLEDSRVSVTVFNNTPSGKVPSLSIPSTAAAEPGTELVALAAAADRKPVLIPRRIMFDDLAPAVSSRPKVFLCGPVSYMAAIREWSLKHGLSAEQILSESFEF